MSITFDIIGKPEPQGSKKAFTTRSGRVVLVESARNVKDWRRLVSDTAQEYAPAVPFTGAVAVFLTFRMPVPKSAPKRRRLQATKKPDIDKIARACLDALTGVMFRDDSQVVHLCAMKRLAYDEQIGCRVEVAELDQFAGVLP